MKNKSASAICWKLLIATTVLLSSLAVPASEVVLIPAGIDVPGGSPGWRYRVGAGEASTPLPAWRTNTFVEDGTWASGALPLGYSTTPNDPNGYEAKLVTTVPAATTNIYLRKTFVLTNRAAFSSIRLGVMVDDGIVAWVNGREVMRFQCCTGGGNPTVPTFDSSATTANESTTNSVIQVADVSGPLIDGTNVLAIQLLNANPTSSDLVLDAILEATLDDVAPTIVTRAPVAGATVQDLNSIQVAFSEAVTNVDASDLLINGLAATNILPVSPTTYTWQFAQPPTGSVSVAFAPGHGITDLASPANAFAGDNWTYTLNTNVILPQFFITEFMAANSGHGVNGIRDEDGDGSDWIEIYNSQSTPGSIGGWYLTDATNNLTKWRFPNGATVPGRGYLVVFASGKNRTNVVGKLHTNFQLASGGEYLGLVNPQTNIISEFYETYPAQLTDISYGRDRVNLQQVGYYTVPTPGADNSTSGTGFGPEVHFSYTNGTFAAPFNLTLSVDDSNSVIRYTIVTTAQDVGSATNIPTTASTLYTGPIAISTSCQVRARAFPTNPTAFPGPPRTECYVLLGSGATNFVSTLPIVVIHTLAGTSISGGYPALDNSVIIECFDNEGGTSTLTSKPQLVTRGGINLRGSSTQAFPKSSFAVELWNEFNTDEEKSFLGLPKESDWVLYSPNGFDKVLMHNPLMHQMGRDMGYYSSRTRFVDVFFRNGAGALTVNTNATGAGMGDYYGVFVLEEKVKRDGNRVDIDKLEPESTNAPAITGGYLLKIDRTDGNERTFNANGAGAINYQDPDGLEMVTPPRAPQAAYIASYFNNMNVGLTGNALTNIASTNHYSYYLDVDATIDLNIVMVVTCNVDGYRLSGYIYKPRNGKAVFGPLWDVDRGLGTSDQGTTVNGDLRAFNPRAFQAWDPLGASDYGTDFFQGATPPGWLGRWFADVDFWQRWIDRYQDWRLTTLDTNYLASVVDRFANEVRAAQVNESRRWGANGSSDTNPRTGVRTAGGGVYTHTFNGTFQGEVDFQKRWLVDKLNFIDTNLLNRPAFPTAEGHVGLGTVVALGDVSGKVGTAIYYTLDGTDPRGFQGTTNPAAILYNGPLIITNNVRIRARAFNPNHRNLTGISGPGSRNPVVSSSWSGDRAATYFVTTPALRITELMYHPGPSADPDQDPDDFEYVELQNTGATTLSLIGFQFTNGITFTFRATNAVTSLAPGATVLIVKNRPAFISRYGNLSNIAGEYSGQLDNSGERITLVGPRLEPVLDFTYSDTWYPVTDGAGWSLVIRDPSATVGTWDDASAWRSSSNSGGSPGAVDPTGPQYPQIYINEALTHTDFPAVDTIELYNAGTNDINVGGWFLTDDPTVPFKYQIPSLTMISAGGYLLFDETNFNTGLNAFALESDGDEVYLFSATAGFLTGYAHGFSFGAAQNGVTFGRYVNSQGVEHFVAQATNSLGSGNSLPLVGPVVISEFAYHPPDVVSNAVVMDNSDDEFIELYNMSDLPVPLYNTLHESNTWRLSHAVSFDFPTNVTIGPTSFVLVVNFSPADTNRLAAFRIKYGAPAATPVFGPYDGKLDNSGESVRLSRPDNPNTNGAIPYIVVDQVDYEDEAPWSKAADGGGSSLQRLVLKDYGNDPTNWTAALPSPGGLFPGGAPPSITQQPSDAALLAGSPTNFTVVASGAGVRVQWRFNGDPIPGATNTTLVLPNVQYANIGSYDVIAYNGAGATLSSNAVLVVQVPTTLTLQPVFQAVQPGTNVTLTSAAYGTGPLRYQWSFQGVDIPDATNANYSFTNANLDQHHGNFAVRVTDGITTAASSNAFIYVMVKPGFVLLPAPQTLAVGGTAVMTAVATGAPPIYYRWVRQGAGALTNLSGVFTFSTNVPASLQIRVAVTNYASGASGVNSSTVNVVFQADADADGVGDQWAAQYGLGASSGPLDFDGDGMSNHDEFIAGTNPTNALSMLKLTFPTNDHSQLQFVAQTNISYTVQYRTNLSVGSPWLLLTNVPSMTNFVRTITIPTPYPPPTSERYYRIVTPLLP